MRRREKSPKVAAVRRTAPEFGTPWGPTTKGLSFKQRAEVAASMNDQSAASRTRHYPEGVRSRAEDLMPSGIARPVQTQKARRRAPLVGIRGYGGVVSIPRGSSESDQIPGVETTAKKRVRFRKGRTRA